MRLLVLAALLYLRLDVCAGAAMPAASGVPTYPERGALYRIRVSEVGGEAILTARCEAEELTCCQLETLTQLVLSLGAHARLVIWPCGVGEASARMPIPPGDASTPLFGRVSIHLANVSAQVFDAIVPVAHTVYVDSVAWQGALSHRRVLPELTVTAPPSSSWRWMHMLGDSVTRTILLAACSEQGWALTTQLLRADAKDELRLACCADGRCLSWERWWFMPPATALPQSGACLWRGEAYRCRLANRSTPDVLYVSFGSHSPQVNASDALQASFRVLLQSLASTGAPAIVWAATSAVHEPSFPPKYAGDLMARNNLRIAAVNQRAAAACEQAERCRPLDLFSLTLAAGEVAGSYAHGDPVHPTARVVARMAGAALRAADGGLAGTQPGLAGMVWMTQ